MLWEDLYSQASVLIKSGNQALADERPIIFVDTSTQCLHYIDVDSEISHDFPVSTSANGLGNLVNSHKTPFGVHQIKEKIGGGQPHSMVFIGREPTMRIADPDDMHEEDEITSRILRLDGLEPGINKGGNFDSYDRYIYIHGTSDEKHIGHPVSIGCIRMTNDDVIELFDEVLVNDLVIIR